MPLLRILKAVFLVAALNTAVAQWAVAATYIIPVVVKGTPGLNGSYWDSEVRILRLSLRQDLVVRRTWVALAGGGFVDEPSTAPSWAFPTLPAIETARMIVLRGSDLLQGVNASHASIGLDIQGEVAVFLHNVNSQGSLDGVLLGSGQLAQATSVPLVGPATVPWATAGEGKFRMSLGFVNTGATVLTLRVYPSRLDMVYSYPDQIDWRYWFDTNALQPLVVTLPPWGWRQIDDVFSTLVLCLYVDGCFPGFLGASYTGIHFFEVEPDDPQRPYFTYASIVYSPLNDPEFVPVIPGSVEGAPRSDFPCPPTCSGP